VEVSKKLTLPDKRLEASKRGLGKPVALTHTPGLSTDTKVSLLHMLMDTPLLLENS
jgi:hypothetical protein